MNFTWLEDFLALAATGNFTRAAQERHSSQPAFSRRIRALEEWLGTPLVDRSTQPALLTEAGEWFRGVAEELVARAEGLPGQARQVAHAGAATLRIASTHALSFAFLPRWLRGLETTLPMGPVELVSDVLPRCEAQLQQGRVQFVLAHAHPNVAGAPELQACESLCVGHDQLLPVSRPGPRRRPLHGLHRDGPGTAPLLAYSEDSGLGRIQRAVLGRSLQGASQPVFRAHLASVLRSMALDGRGLAWLPRTLIQEDLDAGRLVAAGEKRWSVDLDIRLYRPRKFTGRAAEAFWKAAAAGAPAPASA
jgi:LysR family transcriptional regulator, hypochlorite-specific transcription factor HypT